MPPDGGRRFTFDTVFYAGLKKLTENYYLVEQLLKVKRNCPGEVIGMMELLFYFVAIMQRFQILPPKGKAPRLEGTLGLTYHAVPQELRFVRRE
ncbi:cytochrome P450 2J5 [Caerostris extrusa]|uniref:Cytochrome P450 2J5 n=1 Tax=Caerostris extrusa TaxID=172846 RepID=A0AAV4NZ97_CAEEX|nr:cytochrome P450 2J5 [Caerostris extrusa]